jgi:glycosyltransferase AglE
MNVDPIVSIIIPVFNNKVGLERTLLAIAKQTYEKNKVEIIVVDNGSEDDPKSLIEKFDVVYIEEHKFMGSPYSARNRGLEVAKGEIIILLDTTCAPDQDWIKEGVKTLFDGNDLVGGDVVFDVNENSTIGELYDSMINIRMRDSIEQRQVAKTTNLFIRRRVFDNIGYFPEGLRSGGDVRWTGKAARFGHKLAFSEGAKVFILPRKLKPLIKKQWRVSKGQPTIWLENGFFIKKSTKQVLLFLLPPNPFSIFKRIKQKPSFYLRKIGKIYFVAYLIRIIMGIGALVGIMKIVIDLLAGKKRAAA